MPLGDPITGGSMIQGTVFFGSGGQGWSETYFMNVGSSSANPLVAAENAMNLVTTARRSVLPADVTQEALRLSYVTRRGDSNLVFPPNASLGYGTLVANTTNPALGWQMVIDNEDFQVGDTRYFRGWTPTLIPWNPAAGVPADPPPTVLSWAQRMANILTAPVTIPADGSQVRFCLRSFNRTLPAFKMVDIIGVSLSPTGYLQVDIATTDVTTAMQVGKLLLVYMNRHKCARGFAGRFRIVSRITAGAVTSILLDQKPSCVPDDLNVMTGTVRPFEVAYYPIAYARLGKNGKRDTGRRFFVPRGRQSARP